MYTAYVCILVFCSFSYSSAVQQTRTITRDAGSPGQGGQMTPKILDCGQKN